MLNVVLLNIIMLSVVLLNVVMLSVVAPLRVLVVNFFFFQAVALSTLAFISFSWFECEGGRERKRMRKKR